MITHFYEMYFPEGIHKVNSHDLVMIKQLLEDSYSDDVLIPVFINMIHQKIYESYLQTSRKLVSINRFRERAFISKGDFSETFISN